MSAALKALESALRAARGNLDIARRAHSATLADCNARIEGTAEVVGLSAAAVADLEQAIETLGHVCGRGAWQLERSGGEVVQS